LNFKCDVSVKNKYTSFSPGKNTRK